MPALELRDAVKDYPVQRGLRELVKAPFRSRHQRALRGVSLAVLPGEVLALVGPNGSGKTTCVKLLGGLVLPSSGTALVCGVDVARHPERAQARVGYVTSDERSFYWRLTVRQNLAFFGSLHGLAGPVVRERIGEAAEALAFAELLDRPFRTLSSGQKARVAVGRGLLHSPGALLLDEVTRALDPGAAERLRRLLHEELAGRRRLGILLATHDLAEARAVAGRVALLVDGSLKAQGPFAQVEAAIQETFFAAAVADR